MPLPSPKGNQDRKGFISKCMGDPTMKKEFSDPKQRAAICHSKWRKSQGEIEIKLSPKSIDAIMRSILNKGKNKK